MRKRFAIVIGVAAAGVMALGAQAADAYVYWTNNYTIGRASLDGTGVDQSFIPGTGGPTGVAVDAKHLYWTTDSGIGRANLDGSGVESDFITGIQYPFGVAVDAQHIYWTNFLTDTTIGRASLDGTGVDQSFIPITGTPAGVAVDTNHIYWSYDVYSAPSQLYAGAIGRANLDGTRVASDFITDIEYTTGLAVDANHLYWTTWNTASADTIGRANLNGTGVDPAFINTGGESLYDVAVDSGHVYWVNGPNTIGRANLDGTAANQNFISGIVEPADIAVDALPHPPPPDTDPPNTGFTKGAPDRTKKTKLELEFISSEPNSTFKCKLDGKPYKACTSPREVKRLKDGKHKFKVRAIDAAGNVDPSAAKDKFKVVGRHG